MMQIDEILDDLKLRRKNLTALKKEIDSDKAKTAILATVDGLIKKIEPLVTEKKRLEKLRTDVNKFSADVDTYNGKQRSFINAFNTLKTASKSVKDDTKSGDFAEISSDAEMYVALNKLEKA